MTRRGWNCGASAPRPSSSGWSAEEQDHERAAGEWAGQGVCYFVNQWVALNEFRYDGLLKLDNNYCERQIRSLRGRSETSIVVAHRFPQLRVYLTQDPKWKSGRTSSTRSPSPSTTRN